MTVLRVISTLLAMLIVFTPPLRAGTINDLSPDIRPHVIDLIEFNRLSHFNLEFGPSHPNYKSGWRRLDQGKSVSGVSYRVYQRQRYGQPPITLVELSSDQNADPFEFLFADETAPDPQLKWASQYRNARQILSRYRREYPGEVFVSGINVGGALAQHAAMVNGTRAVVFNSAPVSPEAIQAGDSFGLEPGVIAQAPARSDRILHLRYFADLVAAGRGFQVGRQMMISAFDAKPYDPNKTYTLDLIRNHDATALFSALQGQVDGGQFATPPTMMIQAGAIVDEFDRYIEALGTLSDNLDVAKLVLTGNQYLDPYSNNFANVLPSDWRRARKLLSYSVDTIQAFRNANTHRERGELILMSGALVDLVMEIGIYEYARYLREAEKGARNLLPIRPSGKTLLVRASRLGPAARFGMLSISGAELIRGINTMFVRGTIFDQDGLTSVLGSIAPMAAYGVAFRYTAGNHVVANVAAIVAEKATGRYTKEMAETIIATYGWWLGGSERNVIFYDQAMVRRVELGENTISMKTFFAEHSDRNIVAKIGKDMVAFRENYWKVEKQTAPQPRPGWRRQTSSTYREVCTRGVCTREALDGGVIPSQQKTASEQILAPKKPYQPKLAVLRSGQCKIGDCGYELQSSLLPKFDPNIKAEEDDNNAGCDQVGSGGCLGIFSNYFLKGGPPPGDGGGDGGNRFKQNPGPLAVIPSLPTAPSIVVIPAQQITIARPASTTGPGGVSIDVQPSKTGNNTGLGGLLGNCSFDTAGCVLGN